MPRNGDAVFTRKDCNGFFISYKDADGKRRRRKVNAPTMGTAKLALSGERTRAETAKALGFLPPTQKLFAEVAEEFLAHQNARVSPANYERERGIVEDHLKPFFAGQLKAIRKSAVLRYVSKRSGEVSGGTVVKELNVLKHLLRLSSEEWEYIPVNPARAAKAPKPAPGRIRYLQPTELRTLLEFCPEWLRPIVGLAAFTGMRRGEILGLRWLDVDLLNNRVMLPQTKNGDGRIIYLNKMAQTVLKAVPTTTDTKSTDKVFGLIEGPKVSMSVTRLCRRLKIADFRFHDLRHTAASWLRMKGADIHTVAQLLGHKDLRMAARYQHLSPAFLAEAVARLDDAFGEPKCPDNVPENRQLAEPVTVSA
jgi:integrase